jgi:DDE superfamily endonuclease
MPKGPADGRSPCVCKKLWNDLQTTHLPEAQIGRRQLRLDYLLMSMYFLKCYPMELQLSVTFKINERTARRWIRFYLQKIQGLKGQKVFFYLLLMNWAISLLQYSVFPFINQIVWPEQNDDGVIFIGSIDGTHCPINEPRHEDLAMHRRYFSHKIHSAAVNYEIVISIYENKVIWVNGPFPAGVNDSRAFRHDLLDQIPHGKWLVGDTGYVGFPDV